ncbi:MULTISPECIES: GNAT family N-acetyltransferase [unclassified Microbacterium]|uniref:GNAT family N-acetyltransferase n=1 Tax=unclassified Microbacterium TaxID=2609290 RepID=UPI00300FAE17
MEPVRRIEVPEIVGAAVTLRRFALTDIDAVLDASTDPMIPLVTTVPAVADRALAAASIARQHDRAATGAGYSFAIEAESGCVGQIGLWLRDIDRGRATIGYWIRPGARRRGYASAALATLVDWAFTKQEIPRLQLYVEPNNVGSCRTAERAGFEREGLLRSWELVGEQRRDMYSYGLTRERWSSAPRGPVS